MEAAAGLSALKSQIYKVTAKAQSMWYLIQAGGVKVICDYKNVGIITIKHIYTFICSKCYAN